MTAIYQDFIYTCRCCARCETEETKDALMLQSLYERPPESRSPMSIAQIFIETTSRIVITPEDGLPQLICASCVEKVLQMQHFLDMCSETETKLRSSIEADKQSPNFTSFQQSYESFDISTLSSLVKIEAELIPNEDDHQMSDPANFHEPMITNIKEEIDDGDETNETSNSVVKIEAELIPNEDDHQMSDQANIGESMIANIKKEEIDDDDETNETSNSLLHTFEFIKPKTAHTINEQPYKCQYCGLSFESNFSLKRHIQIHDKNRMYNCKFCPLDFRIAAELRKHILEHTNDSSETRKRHLAERQKKDSLLQSKLSITNKTIAGNLVNVNVEYNDPLDIKRGKNAETFNGNKPETVLVYINETNDNSSFFVERDEGAYKCKYCWYNFASKSILIEHLRVHLGDKVHQCILCACGFRSSEAMQEHFKKHENDDAATQKRNFDEREAFDAKIRVVNWRTGKRKKFSRNT